MKNELTLENDEVATIQGDESDILGEELDEDENAPIVASAGDLNDELEMLQLKGLSCIALVVLSADCRGR